MLVDVRTSAATLAVIALLTVSCSTSDDGVRSNTPQITVTEADIDAAALLLGADSVATILGADSVEVTDLNDLALFVNPDPRGPCGGVIEPFDFTDAFGRAFVSSSTTVVQMLAPATDERLEYVAATMADRRDGCAPFESLTNQGQTQRVSNIEFIDVAALGESGVAWNSTVSSGVGGGSVVVLAAIAEVGEHVLLIQLYGVSALPEAMSVALIEAAIAAASA